MDSGLQALMPWYGFGGCCCSSADGQDLWADGEGGSPGGLSGHWELGEWLGLGVCMRRVWRVCLLCSAWLVQSSVWRGPLQSSWGEREEREKWKRESASWGERRESVHSDRWDRQEIIADEKFNGVASWDINSPPGVKKIGVKGEISERVREKKDTIHHHNRLVPDPAQHLLYYPFANACYLVILSPERQLSDQSPDSSLTPSSHVPAEDTESPVLESTAVRLYLRLNEAWVLTQHLLFGAYVTVPVWQLLTLVWSWVGF